MKYQIFPLLAFFTLAFSACEEEEVAPKISGQEVLMSHDWKYQDVEVKQDLSYTAFGMTVDMDTAFSAIENIPACELDFTLQFLADDKLGHTLLDTYCGDDLSQAASPRWKLDQATSDLTLIGHGIAGMMSTDGTNFISLGDTAIYKVLELTDKNFIFEYEMDPAAMMEYLGMGELESSMDLNITGSSKIKVSLVSQ